MKKIKQLRRLKLQWKILIATVLVCVGFGGFFVYASAESSVSVKVTTTTSVVNQGSTSNAIIATLSGTDENNIVGEGSPDNYKPNIKNLKWTVSDPNVVDFVVSDSAGIKHAESVEGVAGPTIYGNKAGRATVTATYTSKVYGPGGEVVSSEVLGSDSVSVYVPLQITSFKAYRNGIEMTEEQMLCYQVGDIIKISSNACDTNRIFVETDNDNTGNLSNDGIVKKRRADASTVELEIVGGGKTNLKVRTADGDGIPSLTATYTISSDVKFSTGEANEQGHYVQQLADGTKYIVLDDTDYVPFTNELIPSNVKFPATSRVTYLSSNTDVFTITAGSVLAKQAGVGKATAGLSSIDVAGNISWTTRDEVMVVVPFKKLGNNVSNMNVGDKLQLSTSSKPTEITWSTSDNSVVQVDATTGLVTAVGAGKAVIYATRVEDELSTVYHQKTQLAYEITVIDGFGLSLTNMSVNIGETKTLQALVTNNPSKSDITYVVENQADAAGVVPTENLITVTQSDDGKTFTITGVAPGTVQIKVTQNVNGVMKTATCVIYVTTPVGEVSINPSSLSIDRGSSDTVQLLFNPAGPTNSKVMWSSSNPAVATVEGDSYTATITGVSGGSTTITVITEDGLKVATCDVYVREPVTGITLNETTVESTMAIGQFQLVATVTPAGEGVNRNVIWSSSNESVCTVDSNGLVKFIKPGYCTIVCKTQDGAFIATCNFIISIPVESIKLDYTDEIMSIGGRLRITAEVLPLTASNRTVSWESSNTNVCIVDSNGLVEAVGTGSCTILCKSLDGGCTAMCNIYVKQPVTQVILNTTDITVRKGQIFWLNATCLPENADNKIVTWESRDTDVCTVENDGKVTATGAGTTSVIATNVDTGLTAYCVVTVTQPVTGITLNSEYQQLWVGAKYAIIPNIQPIDAENKNVTYFSSDTSVATVDEYGVVTALKGGSCIIEVTTEECHLTAACTIDVKEYVSSITLSETDKFMNVGATGTLKAAVGTSTATNKTIVWSSSNNEICSVDNQGNLTAKVPGNVVITATAADGSGVTASCIVRVVNPVTGITIEPNTVRLLVGDSAKVKAVVTPENATIKDVEWTSSNESIATVDEDGEIFALSTGKVKITATSQDGNNIKGVCWVYVTPVVNISSLRINSKEIYMLSGRSRQLSVIVRPVNNTDAYEWYSSDTGIVQVSPSGVITTVGPGTADVFVISRNSSVEASCTVHSLAMSRSSITLEQYDKYTLDVIGTDDNITWRSSNPRVCTVSSSGEVVARRAGTATVTAVVDNKTLSCVVKVTNFR
ncbi:MAG: Ig-like domain-containing protein [Eubacteriales bacterium]|nr:Ig-like domain-containing protein [Eubacteriales bacterium]